MANSVAWAAAMAAAAMAAAIMATSAMAAAVAAAVAAAMAAAAMATAAAITEAPMASAENAGYIHGVVKVAEDRWLACRVAMVAAHPIASPARSTNAPGCR